MLLLFCVQEKENEHQTSGRSTLHQLQKLFFSTSTPRRRNARRSSMPKFDTTTGSFFGLANTSVSTIESKFTADSKRLSTLSRNLFAQTRRVSQKIRGSVNKCATTTATNVDSTPEYEKVHCDSTKLATSRKSFAKKRSSLLKKRSQQLKTQKEKRLAAYNKFRRMSSKVDRGVDETYSIGSELNNTGATYDIETAETTYESDILHFHAEINQCQGPIEIVQQADDEVDFEKLCNNKESESPFGETTKLASPIASSSLVDSVEIMSPKSLGEGEIGSNLSPQSINSNFSGNSTTRMSSHCARKCWSQPKIPKISTYKVESKNFDNDSQSSTQSHHSTQTTFVTTIKSVQSIVSIAWNDSHAFARYYIVSVTILVFALLLALLRA